MFLKSSRLGALAKLSIFAVAFSAASALGIDSASAACGEVAISKGDIKIEFGKDKKISPAPQGTKICQGDTIIAGASSRAKIKMEDGNELNISPDSRIALEEYEYKPSDNKKKVMLNVLYGKVRAATKEENMYGDKAADGQANAFQVKTKSAVAGVRGTDFLTSFDRKTSKSEVVTFKGNVVVGSPGPNGAILNPVSVGAGQKTEAIPGAPPAPPKSVPPKEMDRMSNDTNAGDSGAKKDAPKNETSQAAVDKKEEPKKEGSGGGGSAAGGGAATGGDASSGGSAGSSDGKSASNGGNQSTGNQSGTTGNQSGNRAPSAFGGSPRNSPGGGLMINNNDLGKGPAAPTFNTPSMPGIPALPIIPQVPVIPDCPLCREAQIGGNGKVNITITIPGQ